MPTIKVDPAEDKVGLSLENIDDRAMFPSTPGSATSSKGKLKAVVMATTPKGKLKNALALDPNLSHLSPVSKEGVGAFKALLSPSLKSKGEGIFYIFVPLKHIKLHSNIRLLCMYGTQDNSGPALSVSCPPLFFLSLPVVSWIIF